MFNKEKKCFLSEIKPKASFILGLVAGILLMFVIAFFVLLGVYLNNPTPKNLDNNVQANKPAAASIRKIQKTEAVRGDSKAPITLIEYSDYQCPFCSSAHDTLKQVMDKYGDQIAWVYRHFPLDSIHPYSRLAAQAAECANDQGKFWEYSDVIFEDQSVLGNGQAGIVQIAEQVNLNMNKFNSCLESEKYADKVNEDYQEGIASGVTGTPAMFINGQLVKGALPLENFEQIIDSILEQ